jgi:hypothetical protein
MHARTVLSLCLLSAAASGALADEPSSGPGAPPPLPVPTVVNVAFLGTATMTAPAVVTSQLGLPEGEGLVVDMVAPGSPSEHVLQVNDVLTRFDDQILVNPGQLAVLVHAHAAGDRVTLTYLRAGKAQTASVKLGSHPMPQQVFSPEMGERNFLFHGPFHQTDLKMDERDPIKAFTPDRSTLMIQRHFGDDPAMGAAVHAVKFDGLNGHLVYSDDGKTFDLTLSGGKADLKVTDDKAGVLFSGPVNTPEERAKVPAALKGRLESLEHTLHKGPPIEFQDHGEEGGPRVDGSLPPPEGPAGGT